MADAATKPPFPVTSLPWQAWSEGNRFGSSAKRLSDAAGGTKIGVLMEELPPGKQSSPFHYHLVEEEHVLALEGEATLRLGDDEFLMKAGDYVCFPAGAAAGHAFVNHSDQPFRFLIIGDRDPNDVCVYPDSNKVYVRSTKDVFDRSTTVDYWKGENES